MAEPDAARGFSMGPTNMGAKLNIQTEAAQQAVNQMTAAMKGLEKALQDFGNNAYMMAEKINRHLKSIGDTATQVTSQLAGVGAAVGGVNTGGGRTASTANTVAASSSRGAAAASWVGNATSAATSAIDRVINKDLVGGLSLGTFIGTGGGEGASGFAKDLALSPLRYLRSRINTNRDTAIMASGALNMTAMQQGTETDSMMSTIARFPGSIYGTPQDMLQMFAGAGALGASYNFGGREGGQGVRASGFYRGIREMQRMNPLASVGGSGGLMEQLGGYAGDTGAQQRSMMFTGGAMSMIGAGGRQKSLSEWAESILRWFEGLRPGKDRGKGFDYGSLMAQYFPGSNIDAWFNVNGVPQNMRDYWWTYALGKANKSPTGLTTGAAITIGTDENNVAWQRLRAGSELTRTEFSLAGQMSGQYAQRESSNRWFNELMGSVQEKIIPAISKGPLAWIQFLPDAIEDLLMTGAERGASALFGDVDVGDVGIGDQYGEHGGTGLSGLHPDMKSKVGRMMRANPRLRMNSGLRDTGLQKRLKDKGYGNVSGKPSAHTRGMAADLGPASQYSWIAKNAKRFGLASGRSQGEPWHVGMPGDIRGGGVGDAFDDFIKDVSGFTGSPEGMAGMITKIISTMTGALGKIIGGDQGAASFAQSPDDLYARLVGASQHVTLGIPTDSGATGAYQQTAGGASITTTKDGLSTAGTATGWAPDGRTWLGTAASGRGDKYNMTASPDIIADIRSSDALTRGTAVAKALHNAGFTGENLKTMMKIAYRESHWITDQWVLGPRDTGGGILGVNQMDWTKKGNPSPYTQADVLDPQASAFIAMDMYKGVPPLNRPGAPNSFYPWKINGDPLGGIPSEANYLTESALRKTGLGDIDEIARQPRPRLASTPIGSRHRLQQHVPALRTDIWGRVEWRYRRSAHGRSPRRPPRGRDEAPTREERLMPYRYGIKNTYRPSQLAPKAYGWAAGHKLSYAAADIPTSWVESTLSADTLRQQFAYEWFQSGDVHAGWSGEQGMSNPPFVSGAAGRLHPLLTDTVGKPARILRGYIRRADYDVTDPLSKARLYFMYNPETIQRDYVSYLEQSALDPFNTVYQSGNLIAPPSIMSFSFELFFDRQEEVAQFIDHPGVFVDYQFFDMVVRNVVPSDPNQSNNTLPDNGVMMVNPRDITVVFSPQITVQGRPTNASVTFEKFTHRMVPFRMRIQLQILASYFGPVKDMVEYKKEELPAELGVPIDDYLPSVFDITFVEVERAADDASGLPGGAASGTVDYQGQLGQANDANHKIRLAALQWAFDNVNQGSTKYSANARTALPASADCSGLVTSAYVKTNQGSVMGWSSYPGTAMMPKSITQANGVYVPLSSINWQTDLLPGDILIRPGNPGHTAFFVKYAPGGCTIFDAASPTSSPQVGERNASGTSSFTHLLRPTPLGALGSAATASSYNSGAGGVGASSGILTYNQTVVALTGQGNNIRLAPAALPAWNAWRQRWAGPIPCTSGWRDAATQAANYAKDPNRFGSPSTSYHCKGLAVDVNMDWLGALSASEQTRFRTAAAANGWGQARWRKSGGPAPGYEAPCNASVGTKTDEPWHFSWGGCG